VKADPCGLLVTAALPRVSGRNSAPAFELGERVTETHRTPFATTQESWYSVFERR
jgi:hypothetical protein